VKIAVGADHGGWQLKNHLVAALRAKGHDVDDLGAHGPERVDYPDYAERVSRAVAAGEVDAGVLCCGTGIGMSIAANKVPGVRAAVVSDPYSARMAKEHNHANVLCLGGRVVGDELGRECLIAWLDATAQGERHTARVAKIDALDAARLGASPSVSMATTRPFISPAVKPHVVKKDDR
jgi:ribose 5-phosphate isomerase B